MKKFLKKHKDNILGVITGFDRLIFRGGIRALMYEAGGDQNKAFSRS